MKALLFDLDETILDRTSSLIKFVNWQAEVQLALNNTQKRNYLSRFIELDNYGSLWKDKVYEILIPEFSITNYSADDLLSVYVETFSKFCQPKLHSLDAIRDIKEMGLKLGLVSNGRSPFQERNFASLGISELFDTIVISETVGYRKPDHRIFEHSCRNINVTPSESIFVGDNPLTDIRGANSVGMYTVFIPTKHFKTCAEANSICEDYRGLSRIVSEAR